MACALGAALAQAQTPALPGTRFRTADASDGALYFDSVLQGHLVDACTRHDPETAAQLGTAHLQWLQNRTARLRNGRAYSLKVFEERGTSDQAESDALRQTVQTRIEPGIQADAKTRCAAMRASIEQDVWTRDPALPVATRGGTLADARLTRDIYQLAQARAACVQTESVELLVVQRTPDLIREQWILHGCGKAVPLRIEMRPSAMPDTTAFSVAVDADADASPGAK